MATQAESPSQTTPLDVPIRATSKLPLLLLVLVGVLALGAVVVWAVKQVFGQQETDVKGVLTHTVERTDMLITVSDDGNVESASNVDVKCQVAGGGKSGVPRASASAGPGGQGRPQSGGATILWIVEDGSRVEEGELLVQLDTSALEDQLQQQKIVYSHAEATKIQSEETHGAAALAVREFAEGTYRQQLQVAEADIQIATEALKSAENVREFTENMVRKGFSTPLQLEADRAALQQAQFNLDAAETTKKVLEEFTYEKTLGELKAAEQTAAARFASDEASLALEKAKLERLERQIENGRIYAPQAGMVVYANDNSNRFGGSSEPTIEEGAQVREGQTIIRLPDLENMQVKMTVHESKVDQIEPGMPARITILGQNLAGHVVSIANQPEPGSWFTANVKEYATTVAIDGQMDGLRPGMTASVVVLIDEIKDALTVPVSAVVENRGKFYSYLRTPDGKTEERAVIIGRSNESYVQIIDGLKEGDVVLRNPRAVVPEARNDTPLEEPSTGRSEFGERTTPPSSAQGRPGGPGQPGGGRGGPGGGRGGPGGGRGGPGGGQGGPGGGRGGPGAGGQGGGRTTG